MSSGNECGVDSNNLNRKIKTICWFDVELIRSMPQRQMHPLIVFRLMKAEITEKHQAIKGKK